jgi:hypothetical protein
MPAEMTSRERLLAAMRNEPVDCLPCAPFGTGRLDIESDVCQELIKKTDIFLETWAGGDRFLGKHAQVDTTKNSNGWTHVIKTPKGDLTWRAQRTEATVAKVEYPLKTVDDIDTLLSIPYEEPDINPEPYFEMKRRYDDEGVVLVGIGTAACVPADWFGPERFCLFWATDRDRIIELNDVMNERVCRYVRKCCEAGITDFRLVGGEYVTVQIGPNGMEDLIRRPDRRVIDIIHEYDGVAFYHNHGPVMRFLEDFAHIGLDFLEPMEAPPWGDCHLGKAKDIIGDRYCMVGNLDDMEIIEKLPAEDVLQVARERIDQAGLRGFVLGGTASGTYTEKGARNLIAMAELAHRCRP